MVLVARHRDRPAELSEWQGGLWRRSYGHAGGFLPELEGFSFSLLIEISPSNVLNVCQTVCM